MLFCISWIPQTFIILFDLIQVDGISSKSFTYNEASELSRRFGSAMKKKVSMIFQEIFYKSECRCRCSFWRTETRKNENLPYSIRLYYTNFWQLIVLVQQNIFEKNLVEVCGPHLYPSLGTSCVQIGGTASL